MAKIKMILIIIGVAQLTLFALFVFLMTTVNPKKVMFRRSEDGALRGRVDAAENDTSDLFAEIPLQPEEYLDVLTNPKLASLNEVVKNTEEYHLSTHFNKSSRKTTENITTLYKESKPHLKWLPNHSDHQNETVTLLSLENITKNPELIRNGNTETCNKTECTYRLLVENKLSDKLRKTRREISAMYSKYNTAVGGGDGTVAGSKPSLELEKYDVESDAVLLRFLGLDIEGSPIIEIKIGSNLIVNNPLGSRHTSIIKWLPCNKDNHSKYNECFICNTGNVTELQRKNKTLHYLYKVPNETQANVTQNVHDNGQRNMNESFEHIIEKVKTKAMKQVSINTLSDNITQSIYKAIDKVVKENKKSQETSNQTLTIVDSQYETDFGGNLDNIGTEIEFFEDNKLFDTLIHNSTESFSKDHLFYGYTKLPELADNLIEFTDDNHTNFTRNNSVAIKKYVPGIIEKYSEPIRKTSIDRNKTRSVVIISNNDINSNNSMIIDVSEKHNKISVM